MSPWASGNTAPHPFQMISRMKSRSRHQEVQGMSRNTSITIAPHLPHSLIQPPPSHMQDLQFLPHITDQFLRELALPPKQELVKIPSSVNQECTGRVERAKQARTPVYTSRVHSCSFLTQLFVLHRIWATYVRVTIAAAFAIPATTMSLMFEHHDCSLTYSGSL